VIKRAIKRIIEVLARRDYVKRTVLVVFFSAIGYNGIEVVKVVYSPHARLEQQFMEWKVGNI